jgi:hypothetical protein
MTNYSIGKASIQMKIGGENIGKESYHDYSKKTIFDEMKDSMKLPEGKTCSDCAHWSTCDFLFACIENDTECDFSPSRFTPEGKGESDECFRVD